MFCLNRRQSTIAAPKSSEQGFTLLEILVVVVMVGVLGAIATPTWVKFWADQQVDAARDEIHAGIKLAQNRAMIRRVSWQFSLRKADNHLEWAVHQPGVDWSQIRQWQPLDQTVVLDDANTLTAQENRVHYVLFDFRGTVKERSIITLESQNAIADKKCVLVQTLLGKTADGKELDQPNWLGFECF
jgi:prepilin-type N-terminal cleavage/methylation domain-containing protein